MSYLVLARKYRPADFASVNGQEHVTRTLKNSIRRGKVAHAILLCGPRGVGKTSIARIFAKALNCEKPKDAEPCLKCTNCSEIALGSSLAVREIDGASHNSVDNVRELIESFRSLPAPGYTYKVYIIDEVHMLSLAAFNALLKSLEEPPPNTVFILATTEPHKIPDTVISRCQRHDLRALSAGQIEQQLKKIVSSEKLEVQEEVIRMVSRLADGSMRDAQSLLDRIQSFCGDSITADDASRVLGVVNRRILFGLSAAIVQRDSSAALRIVIEAFGGGLDSSIFLKEFVSHWRDLFLAKFTSARSLEEIGVPEEDLVELKRQVEGLNDKHLRGLYALARQGCDLALRSHHPKYALEALVVQMATLDEQSLDADRGVLSSPASGTGVRPSGAELKTARAHPAESEKKAEQPAKAAARSGKQLDWWGFVKGLTAGSSKMLAEYVKRLAVLEFSLGKIVAIGPEFTVRSLQQGAYKDKLVEALAATFSHKAWEITLTIQEESGPAQGTAQAVSVADHEKQQLVASAAEKKKSLLEHPQLKQLQKAFPGSAIEDIKIRD
ncbi:MAG: DNA polymerase III subunit gamma/tau [Deltaproteobacteria bacterium]|nr:DNA polymerase III subunit gamma/tau [Deltaproteobacteria bacterium]